MCNIEQTTKNCLPVPRPPGSSRRPGGVLRFSNSTWMAATYAYLLRVPVRGRGTPPRTDLFPNRGQQARPRMPLGEELANVLLLACCYQEVSRPQRLGEFVRVPVLFHGSPSSNFN